MAFDPITLLTISALLLGTMGALMIRSARGERRCAALRQWGTGFMTSAVGLAMILTFPQDVGSPVRVLGNAALLLGFGLVWAAARRFGRGAEVRPSAAAAGALAWLALMLVFEPTLEWRIGISSAVIAGYSLAAARELLRTRSRMPDTQRHGGFVLAAHGTFYALRAVFGPTLGFAAWGRSLSQGRGALIGLETMLFAVVFGAIAIAMSRERVAEAHRHDALEDALTGIGNRRALFASGTALLADAVGRRRPLALLMMDLDRFKGVNDRHGHAAGDRLLVAFARLAHDYLPPTSLVCRLGGEEFAALLPGAEPERACAIADELRSLFSHLAIEGSDGAISTTVSIGIAQARPGGGDMTTLLGAADRCLYAAKTAGRNLVVHEMDLSGADLRPAA